MSVKLGKYGVIQGAAMLLFGVLMILKQWADLAKGVETAIVMLSLVLIIIATIFNLMLYGKKNQMGKGVISKKYLACFTFFNVVALANFVIWFIL